MRSLLLRVLLLSSVLAAGYAGSTYTHFEPEIQEAGAQELAPTPDPATVSPTATATEAPTPVPTEVAPSPTATSDLGPPAPTSTATTDTPSRTVTTTETATATAVVTTTPVPTPVLPAISDEPDPPDTVTEAVIGSSGGTFSTPDGRLILTFSANAVAENIVVSITQGDTQDLPILSSHPIWRAWSFDARGDASGQPVTSFDAPVTVTTRFEASELGWVDPNSLRLWQLDSLSQNWQEVAGIDRDATTWALTAQLNHFSTYGVSADYSINLAPFSDFTSMNLHSGSAQINIPIEVPVGPGGLSPNLSLSYDSGRLNSMRRLPGLSSWAGLGWDISTGSIQRTSSYQAPYGNFKYSIEMDGVGGGLTNEFGNGWLEENHTFNRIELFQANGVTAAGTEYCRTNLCTWRVTDKQGTQYFFGGTANAAWIKIYLPGTGATIEEYIRWDLRRILDVNGNEINITYNQRIGGANSVIDSHPSLISWDDDHYAVEFDRGPSGDYISASGILVRQDTPRDCSTGALNSTLNQYEISRLKSLTVKVDGSQVRRYDFNHTTSDFCGAGGGDLVAPMMLNTVTERGRNGGALRTMTFTYEASAHVNYSGPGGGSGSYTWPLLTKWENGFGGAVTFAYQDKVHNNPSYSAGQSLWSVTVVSSKTVSEATPSIQPDVVVEYVYADGPSGERETSLLSVCGTYCVRYEQRYLGFGQVTETDAAGTTREHLYYAADTDLEEALTGREKQVTLRSSANELLAKTVNSWSLVELPNSYPNAGSYPDEDQQRGPRFVFLDRKDDYLRDATPSNDADNPRVGTDYTYDITVASSSPYTVSGHGDLIEQHGEGDPSPGVTTDDTYTSTPVLKNLTNWIFAPQYQRVTDLPASNPAAVELRRSDFFYDGLSTSTSVSLGRLTATGTKLSATETSYIYTQYEDPYGNVIRQSNPTFTAPSVVGSYGAIPSGVPYSETTYDSTYHVLPVQQLNPLNHVSATAWDAVLQRPIKLTEPTTHWTRVTYDEFGRPLYVWDQLDGEDKGPDNGFPSYTPAYASQEFIYSWGTVPNSITTKTRVNHGTDQSRDSIKCMDGFGRQVDTRSENGSGIARVRTDYDSRGLTATTTSPFWGAGINCTGITDSVTPYDRTSIEYDAAGNAVKSLFKPANNTAGPYVFTETIPQGLKTTYIDEKRHGRTEELSLGANTLTVKEYTGLHGTWITPYATTSYQNDRLGQLTKVTDALGNETRLYYDLAGRKVEMDDPDMGQDWLYTYDAAGNLKTQRDARLITTTLTYDNLQRLRTKTYSSGEASVEFRYDGGIFSGLCAFGSPYLKGKMTREDTGTGANRVRRELCYDVRGRSSISQLFIGEVSQGDILHEYDALGAPKKITYPDFEEVTYTNNSDGAMTAMAAGATPLLTGATLTPPGAVGRLTFANSRQTDYAYDARTRLSSIKTSDGGVGVYQHLSMTYDDASNVASVTDYVAPAETVNYAYDDLDRLTGASNAFTAAYSYNAIGNLLTKQEGASNLMLTYPASGATSVRPHAVSSTTGSLVRGFTYDQNGNQIGGGDHAYDFDAENRVRAILKSVPAVSPATGFACVNFDGLPYESIGLGDYFAVNALFGATRMSSNWDFRADLDWTGSIGLADSLRQLAQFGFGCDGELTRYTYDGSGTQIKRAHYPAATSPSPDIATTYVGGIYEKTNAGAATKYYGAYGRPIAMRVPSGAVNYLMADHLGGTTGLLNSAGDLVFNSQTKYWPYGNTRSTTEVADTDMRFTGQREEPGDAALGLYNYKARFYSTVLGRFVSADPFAPSYEGAATSRYTYVFNSPVSWSDPSGFVPCMDCLPRYEDEEIANFWQFALAARLAGLQLLSPEASLLMFGAATPGTIYAISSKSYLINIGAGALALAAGTYLLGFDTEAVFDGEINNLFGQGTLTVNSETTATDFFTGEQVNFYAAASDLLNNSFGTGYFHYTGIGSAAKIAASRLLLSSDGQGGPVYATKDVYVKGSTAKDRLGIDPNKTVNAVVAFTTQATLRGPQAAPKLGTNIPAGGTQYEGTDPVYINPVFVTLLLP